MNLQASEEGRLIRSNLRDLREEARRLERALMKEMKAKVVGLPLGQFDAVARPIT